MPKVLNYRVIIEQDEDGVFVASVPSIQGCYTEGDTYEEAIKNIKEVIELCLEVARDNKSYRERIEFPVKESTEPRFLGITEVPVKFNFT